MSFTSIYRMVAVGRADGQEIINHMDYAAANTGEGGTLTVVGDEQMISALENWAALWNSEITPLLATNYRIREWRCREIVGAIGLATLGAPCKPDFDREVVHVEATDSEGEAADPPTPTTEAVGLRKVTATGLRYFHGGMRLGPLSEGYTVVNTLTDPALTAFTAAANALEAEFLVEPATANEITFTPGVYSAKHQVVTAGADPIDSWRAIIALVVNQQITTQRSRHRKT